MPRRIFAAGSVTNATGAPLRLAFYKTQTTGRQETDLMTLDGSSYPDQGIPRGIVLTDVSGAYSTFCGPDDVDALWIAPSNGAARTQISATGNVAGSPAGGLGSVVVSGTPTTGQVVTATGSTAATWQTPTGAVTSVVGQTGAITGTQIAADAALAPAVTAARLYFAATYR